VQERRRFRRSGRHREIGRGLAHEAAIAEDVGGQVVVSIHQQDMAQVGQPVADAVNLLSKLCLVSKTHACESPNRLKSASSPKLANKGPITARAFRPPRKAMNTSGSLGNMMKTRAPGATPSLVSTAANRVLSTASCPEGEISPLPI